MKPTIHLVFSICLALSFSGCDNDDQGCQDEPSAIPFETFVLAEDQWCMLNAIDETKPQIDLIIQTQDDYEKYVECSSDLPSIDFSEKTLLAGRLKTPYQDKVITQTYTRDCKNRYVFHVEIGLGIAPATSNVFYFAIVPKTAIENNVIFDVEYRNQ